jgi:hypothetical protein
MQCKNLKFGAPSSLAVPFFASSLAFPRQPNRKQARPMFALVVAAPHSTLSTHFQPVRTFSESLLEFVSFFGNVNVFFGNLNVLYH